LGVLPKEKISEMISLLSHEDYTIGRTGIKIVGKLVEHGEESR
jgi:hypothetical protein